VTVRPYYDVWCDGPGRDGDGCIKWNTEATGDTQSEARKRSLATGWIYKRGVGDLCPECQRRVGGDT
jgi:hypothetical protein